MSDQNINICKTCQYLTKKVNDLAQMTNPDQNINFSLPPQEIPRYTPSDFQDCQAIPSDWIAKRFPASQTIHIEIRLASMPNRLAILTRGQCESLVMLGIA